MNQEVLQHAIDQLKDGSGLGVYGCDLHNELFNTDSFVIGCSNAEKLIEEWGGAWACIRQVIQYEDEQFGEVHTKLSCPEKVANMVAYINGEELLNSLDSLQERWDDELEQADIDAILEELEAL